MIRRTLLECVYTVCTYIMCIYNIYIRFLIETVRCTGSIIIYTSIIYILCKTPCTGIRDPIENDAKKIKDPGNLVPIRVVLYF